jgi:hypothetical protein
LVVALEDVPDGESARSTTEKRVVRDEARQLLAKQLPAAADKFLMNAETALKMNYSRSIRSKQP